MISKLIMLCSSVVFHNIFELVQLPSICLLLWLFFVFVEITCRLESARKSMLAVTGSVYMSYCLCVMNHSIRHKKIWLNNGDMLKLLR